MRQFMMLILSGLLALYAGGCGAGSPAGFSGSEVRTAGGLRLEVDPATFSDGASSGFELQVRESGDDLQVDIVATAAVRLKQLYFSIAYDPESLRPLTSHATTALGPASDMLELSVLRERGALYHAQTLTLPQLRSGLSGSAVVARAVFRREAAPLQRAVSAAPDDSGSRSFLLRNANGDLLTWDYYASGDYNQDGKVLGTDLGPIGLNFLASVPADPNGPLAVVDGVRDGRILATDLGPIGLNFLKQTDGFNVYSYDFVGYEAHYPASGSAPSDSEPLGFVAFGDTDTADGAGRTDNPAEARLQFSFSVPLNDATVYWVRPMSSAGGGSEGIASNPVGESIVLPAFSVIAGTSAGSGTLAEPYQVSIATPLELQVLAGDGSTPLQGDADTKFIVSPAATGTVAQDDEAQTALFTFTPTASGVFGISSTFLGIPCDPFVIYCDLGETAEQGLFIFPADNDLNWQNVPNFFDSDAGTFSNPYVLADSGFNTIYEDDGFTLTLLFPLRANDLSNGNGNPVDATSLEWAAGIPPLIVFPNNPNDGSFQVTGSANTYISATNDEPLESNRIFVKSSALSP